MFRKFGNFLVKVSIGFDVLVEIVAKGGLDSLLEAPSLFDLGLDVADYYFVTATGLAMK